MSDKPTPPVSADEAQTPKPDALIIRETENKVLDTLNERHELVGRTPDSIVRFGWLVLVFGFFGFIAWAAFAPLDSGVTATGEIVVDSKRVKIQHLTGGIVEEILVRDGDHVTRDQPLIKLNRTRIQSELAIVSGQLLSSTAVEKRLMAERDSANTLNFPEALLTQARSDPRLESLIATQQQLFAARRAALANELSMLDESIVGLNQQLRGLQAQRDGKTQQLAILSEELESLQLLFEQGYVPRVRIFELERAVADVQARRSEDDASIGRLNAALNEARLRKFQVEKSYQQEVETQLSNIQREVDGLTQRQISLQDDLDRVEVRAPVDGVVVGLRINSPGGVIRPSEDILDIVPDGEPLVIDARVPVQSIELVTIGQDAMIRFSALSRLNPVVNGVVTRVSADALTDERTGMPYYNAKVEVPPEEFDRLDYERIVPGMPVEVVIKTEQNSLLYFLLKPILDHTFLAFRER